MTIANLKSPRSDRPVANQFVAYDGRHTYFQSYNSLVCTIDGNAQTITFGRDWNYSRTTSKYLRVFMNEYAPRVAFEWSTRYINDIIREGAFVDDFGRLWTIYTEA